MTVIVHLGDCFDVLCTLSDESVHAVVCDPPYGINFMGKAWDGKAIEEAAARPVPLAGVERLTGSPDSPTRKLTARTGSAFANRAGEAGAYDFTLRGNRAFQQWVERWGAECLRVLKPGGHLLSFGGTRTYHRLAAGLEDAGFEIRDCLCWMFGSGFPKSLDVAQSIDKAARGVPQGGSDPTSPNHGRFKTQATEGKRDETDVGQGYGAGPGAFMAVAGDRAERGLVEPAKEWEGWGTALKPAFEPIVLARKPLIGTVAGNVLAHGTGALNVDACRIAAEGEVIERSGEFDALTAAHDGYTRPGASKFTHKPTERSGPAQELGRWPANVVLDEDAAAMLDEQTGTLTSGSEPDAGFVRHPGDDPAGIYGGGKGLWIAEGDAGSLYGDSGGASRFFFTARKHILEGCATAPTAGPSSSPDETRTASAPGDVATSDSHAATPSSDSPEPSTSATPNASSARDESAMPPIPSTASESSPASPPSRPSPIPSPVRTAEPSDPTDITTTMTNPSTSTGAADDATSDDMLTSGEAGALDSLPIDAGAERFMYCAKVSRAERNAGCDGFDPRMMRWSSGDQPPGTFQSEGTDKTARNHHPTVKPVALMRWLVRLVTSPGGTVLDPFAGSGSTGIAAALEGFDFIGIEREVDYHRIAEARIAWWIEHGDRALDIAKVAEREKPVPDQQSIDSEFAR